MCLAVPGKILSIERTNIGNIEETNIEDQNDDLSRVGRISFGGAIKQVSLAYVPEAQVGDYVVVHVGFAIAIVDEAEAQQTLADLQQIQTIASQI